MMQLRQCLLVKPVPFRWLPILIRPVSRDRLLIGRILPNIKDTYRFKFWASMIFMSNTGTAQIGDQTYQNTGTAERLAGSLNQAESDFKAANPDGTTIRVEAGDMVGASPANSALLQDESIMHALKAMHIEYGTLGNHEFDEGLGEFNRIVTGGQPSSIMMLKWPTHTKPPTLISLRQM